MARVPSLSSRGLHQSAAITAGRGARGRYSQARHVIRPLRRVATTCTTAPPGLGLLHVRLRQLLLIGYAVWSGQGDGRLQGPAKPRELLLQGGGDGQGGPVLAQAAHTAEGDVGVAVRGLLLDLGGLGCHAGTRRAKQGRGLMGGR